MRPITWFRTVVVLGVCLLATTVGLVLAPPVLAVDTSKMPGQLLDVVNDPTGDTDPNNDLEGVALSADGAYLVVGFYTHEDFTAPSATDYHVFFIISIDTDSAASTGSSPGHPVNFHVQKPFPTGGLPSSSADGTSFTVADPPRLVLLRIPALQLLGATSIRWQVSKGYFYSIHDYGGDYVPDGSYDYAKWRTTALPAAWGTKFSDVPFVHAYYQQIMTLTFAGVVGGYGSGTFGPDDPVTRQQFAKMIVKAMGLTVTGAEKCPFADVKAGLDSADPNYPDKYVAVCAAHGIASGQTATKFAPYANLTRAQLITMVARAGNLPDYSAVLPYPISLRGNPPFGNFDSVHYPYARRAWYAGYLSDLLGVGKDYDFFRPATRGEVCALLHHLYQSR